MTLDIERFASTNSSGKKSETARMTRVFKSTVIIFCLLSYFYFYSHKYLHEILVLFFFCNFLHIYKKNLWGLRRKNYGTEIT